ncbi:MBL fold metallo-hydrolase [Patescibacteria group bacterium]
MEITYIGHACFRIKGKDTTVVIDPYDPTKVGFKLPKLGADIVLTTHDHDDHGYVKGVSDYKLHIKTPGEYEMAGTYISGFSTKHDTKNGVDRGDNTIYFIEIDGFNLLHLGDLGHELSKETMERLPDIDILMIPVGGTYTINANTATKVISSIEPKAVIPMHYQTEDLKLSKKLDGIKVFLEAMGEENGIKEVESLKVSRDIDLPSEEMGVFVLKPKH